MAEAALAMSLDDLIKNKKKEAPKKKSKGGAKGGSKHSIPFVGGHGSKGKGIALGISKGGVVKGGSYKVVKAKTSSTGIDRHSKRDPDAPGKWGHDMYQEGLRSRSAGGASDSITPLNITNLADNVTINDIKDLVQDYKSVVQCNMKYDRRVDAQRCKIRYTNMALDGQVMRLEIGDESVKGGSKQLSSGLRLTPAVGSSRGGARKNSEGGNTGRALQQAFREVVTDNPSGQQRKGLRGGRLRGRGRQALGNLDLDADFSDYMQQ